MGRQGGWSASLLAMCFGLLWSGVAWAGPGLVPSKAEVSPEGPFQPYAASHAVVIGIDDYQMFPDLSGAARDAKAMANELSRRGFEVTTILNDAATRRGILSVLQVELPKKVGPEDRVLIYFAGHGISQGEGSGAMGYLLPVESNPQAPSVDGIDMESLQRVLATQYKAKHILYVADACYSGLALSTRSTGLNPANENYLRQIASRPVKLAFAAGASGEEAHEWRGHGLFTYHLLEALRGSADRDGDGLITSAELWPYLQKEVTAVAARKGWAQTPQYGRSGEGEFVFFSPESRTVTASAPVAAGPPVGMVAQSAGSSTTSVAPWVVVGTGVAAAAVGAGVSTLGYGQRSELVDGLGDPGTPVTVWTASEAKERQDTANRNILTGQVLMGVGVAAAVAGVTWRLLGGEGSEDAEAPAAVADTELDLLWLGSSLQLQGRF